MSVSDETSIGRITQLSKELHNRADQFDDPFALAPTRRWRI